MSDSVLAWVALALLLFWSIGAYNRLVRLRAEVKAGFAVLEAQLLKEVQLVRSLLPADEPAPDSLFPGEGQPPFWTSLEGAASQLAATLTLARGRPLDPERIAALATAGDVLATAWERIERKDAHDLAGPRLPPSLTTTRATLLTQARAAVEQFNRAVADYNRAIAQFPAMLLAWVFDFKPGRPL